MSPLLALLLAAAPLSEAKADAPKEVKILGHTNWIYAPIDSKFEGGPQAWVIRNEDDLAKVAVRDDKDGAKRKQVLAMLAKGLKVEAIDFKKHQLIAVSGGVQRSGGYRVEVLKVEHDGKAATVHWKLHAPTGAATTAITHPATVILVERFDGDVKFNPAVTGEKKKDEPRK